MKHLCCGLLLLSGSFSLVWSAEAVPAPSALVALSIEPQGESGQPRVLAGRDDRLQLLVTGTDQTGHMWDLTRRVTYRVAPEGAAQITSEGYLVPLRDGAVTVQVEYATAEGSWQAELPLQITGTAHEQPVNFPNQVVPIFTKLGCNGGGCHGKASGQNGFKLSLLGFHPEDDYEFLVKEGRGRRLMPLAPEQSLLLTKPVGQSPHGGGKRLEVDSDEYRLLVRWLRQGMPFGTGQDPHVVAIRCRPAARLMQRGQEQQIAVDALYSDGRIEDVTRRALFEPNDAEMAEVSVRGLVKVHDLAGEVAIMARYQGQVAVFRATIPLGAEITQRPPVHNFIDELIQQKLDMLGIPASALADDATFLRRVCIDLTGRLPAEDEVTAFLSDPRPEKRQALIERLLNSPAYADTFANKWNMVLRNRNRGNDQRTTTFAFYRWIWNSLYENKPYDQFVREIITAAGDAEEHPPVTWYREVDQVNEQVEDVAQLFLGLRIQCARCHHHPFEKWSQDDYYGFAAFFSRVGKKNLSFGQTPLRDRRVFHQEGIAQARNERTGKMLPPTELGGRSLTIPAEEDPRVALADWMARPDNPYFARAIVNRYWKHFFGRGLVDPEDDMRETNPPSHPELLERLARAFIESGFDLKQLCRWICQSSTYQLSAEPNAHNMRDKQNFSRFYPRRLSAEVLYDAFHQVTGTQVTIGGLPPGIGALQVPDPSLVQNVYFLKVFGQPQADTACECERSMEANLAQSLHLLNGAEIQAKIAANDARPARWAADQQRSAEDKVRELYRWVYAREPQADELQVALAHLEKHRDQPRQAWEDLMWALLNTKEFLFNH
ncbi:MAG: S-layer protein [Planctomycetaceae bacterium]|nr:MAG: S-layer protein [Planctomycetaceae bacterium]